MDEMNQESLQEETRSSEETEERVYHSRARRKNGGGLRKAAAVFGVLLLAGVGAYAFRAQSYKKTFFPNTSVNGVDVSGLTSDGAKVVMNDSVRSYSLTLKSREQEDDMITAEESGLEYVFDETFDNLIAAQNPYLWGLHVSGHEDYEIAAMGKVDPEAFETLTGAVACLQENSFRAPEDARISDFIPGTGYEVIPEKEGTKLDREKAKELIRTAICELKPELDLDQEEVYDAPKVRQDDPVLNASCESLNRYSRTVVNYDFGGIVLDGSVIRDWLTLSESGDQVSVDTAKAEEYVKNLASRYDTWHKAKPFRTSWDQDITIRNGYYGWKINQKEETDWILSTLPTGETIDRTPSFSRTAAAYGDRDYGDTYVEVNLTAQHLYFYKNGKQIVSSDLVSGNVSKGTITHPGIYPVAYKQRNATLKGQGYSTKVNYWMPFNGGEGLHDASWRGSFGGKIYMTNGSHGCVNLPFSAAKSIYENIDAGTPVIIYSLGGTGSSTTTPAAAQETTAAAETTATAESSAAAETTAAAAAPAETAPVPAAPGPAAQAQETPAPAAPAQETAQPGPGTQAPAAPVQETPAPAAPVQETTAAPVQDAPSPGGPSPAIVQPVPSENSSPEEAGPGTVQPVPDSVPAGPGA